MSHSIFTVSHRVFLYSLVLCDINFFFVPQCLTVFFRTLWYSVSYSVVLCGIKYIPHCFFLFHSVSQCFFVLCATLCRTLWYSVELNYSAALLFCSTVFHRVFTVSHSVFSYSVVLCDIDFFFVPQCFTVFSQCFFVLCVTLCRTLWYSVTLISFFVPQCFTVFSQCLTVFFAQRFFFVPQCLTVFSQCLTGFFAQRFFFVPQCFTVFFRTLCYSVSYSVVLCGIKLFRSVSLLFHSVSQCFHSVSQCGLIYSIFQKAVQHLLPILKKQTTFFPNPSKMHRYDKSPYHQ